VAKELKLDFAWSPEKKAFVSSDRGEWRFLGYIDRVDVNDECEYVILDYKSSTSAMSNFNQWVKKGELQLGIYAQALNQAKTGLPKGKVVGAFYYDLREMERKKGFGQKDCEHGMFATDKRSVALASRDELQTAFAEFNEHIYSTIEKIGRGRLQPQPRQIEDCQSCRWRNLCRAPHLN
jgi:ATP-dependent helicase/DNAse subunit B